MSKRNFILLIIILTITIIVVFGFLYFNQPTTNTTEDNTVGTNFFSQFNPFNNKNKPVTTPTTPNPIIDVSGGDQTNQTPEIILKLKKVSSMPIAGFTIFSKERLKEVNPTPTLPLSGEGVVPPAKGGSGGLKTTKKPLPPLTEFAPALRYVDRATGNIYQTFADKIEERKFSTTIIPKIYEALFGSKAESVVMRYLKTDEATIDTFVGNIPKEYLGADTTASNEIKGSFLPENIKDLSLSSDASSVFYLFNSGDSMVGTTMNLLTNKKVQIFVSPFTEWLSQWPNTKIITLNTKPSSGIPGYMYVLDPISKNLNKVLGGINGLTTLTSPDGKSVLYSNNNLSLSIYNINTKISNLLGIKTLPEKCVWGKISDVIYCSVPKNITPALYPDAWYQGEVSFEDQIWKIDVKTGNATLLADPFTINGEDVDGIKLAIEDSGNYLFFVNKKDSFLWEFNLK